MVQESRKPWGIRRRWPGCWWRHAPGCGCPYRAPRAEADQAARAEQERCWPEQQESLREELQQERQWREQLLQRRCLLMICPALHCRNHTRRR